MPSLKITHDNSSVSIAAAGVRFDMTPEQARAVAADLRAAASATETEAEQDRGKQRAELLAERDRIDRRLAEGEAIHAR